MCFVLKDHQDKAVIGINEVCGWFLLVKMSEKVNYVKNPVMSLS